MSTPQNLPKASEVGLNDVDSDAGGFPHIPGLGPLDSNTFWQAEYSSHRSLKPYRPFNSSKDMKVLLLENINNSAVEILKAQGYNIEWSAKSLSEEQLIEKIKDVHILGVRSKTKINKKVLAAAKNLIAIGCFCIGTNGVDLEMASQLGIPVYNCPRGSGRSVAELVITLMLNVGRRVGDRNNEMHKTIWNKFAKGCHEIRGRTLGIVGYGNIGRQVSEMAEALGCRVIYHDYHKVPPVGSATQVDKLETLLKTSDFITFHVPSLPSTDGMIGKEQIAMMKKGCCLINTSRGTIVQLEPLVEALKSGHLGGCAVDVYTNEPKGNCEGWITPLQNCPNTILTPHIGGSTEEAQYNIGTEVANRLVKYINCGETVGAVNFAQVPSTEVPSATNVIRILNFHKNVPGVLKAINHILYSHNIENQVSKARGSMAYLQADITVNSEEELLKVYSELSQLQDVVRTRIVH
ncbi:hypothetical protein BCR36DRAFT_584137 [Piromyces finnis]|uniref:Phosphoglycerate dehydrogenase n=1 Tax=Piromyces finnis TaxID=1754191 RepID=A0A1Y1V7M5_9FUNG|nr:hypothetical protein BCR36DRAFT_584137 [Piromyces finnis]|eukprot:ORX49030.1 hypothetical protein BCR36DRAFT_584137 [Piromyces finnis]